MSKIGNKTLLGAQMSAYATLYFVSKELNQELVFFKRFNKQRRVRMGLRHSYTDFGCKLYIPFEIPNKLLDEKIKTCFIYKFINNKIYFEKYFPNSINGFDNNIFYLNSANNYDIQSPFGLYKHWKNYLDEILNIFTFRKNIYNEALERINEIKNHNNNFTELVSVHFRRGDYLTVSSLNLSLKYYLEAFKIFQEPKYSFLIFSDDINYCKQIELLNKKNVYFLEGNTDHVDMCMMSMCDHNIIANSSFSFWGALLNKNKNKIVVCPKNYIGEADQYNQYMNGNYYPSHWTALNTL